MLMHKNALIAYMKRVFLEILEFVVDQLVDALDSLDVALITKRLMPRLLKVVVYASKVCALSLKRFARSWLRKR